MAQLKYLDLAGLNQFWIQAKTYIADADSKIKTDITGTEGDTAGTLTLYGLKKSIDQISGGDLVIPVATEGAIGGVKSGNDITVAGDGAVTVDVASKLRTAQTITLTGGASGSASFDGSAGVSIDVTVDPAAHAHEVSQVNGLQDALDLKAPLESPDFTGTPTAPTAAAGTNNTQVATTAYVDAAVAKHTADLEDGVIYRGVVNSDSELPTEGVKQGDLYKVATAGTYAGVNCEVGDMLIYNGTGWDVIQTNIDGAVTGPASAVDGNIAIFDGATGKLIKDSSITSASVSAAITKLAGIAEGAEVNQNAFASVSDGSTTISATAKSDTLTITGTNGVSVSAADKTVTISVSGFATSTELSTLADRVTAVENKLTDVTSTVGASIDEKIAALDLSNTYAAKSHTHTVSEITDFTDSVNTAADARIEAYIGKDAGTATAGDSSYIPTLAISTEDITGLFN